MAFNLADMVNNRKPVETENISDTVYRDVFELEPSKENFYSTDPERLQGLKNSILLFGVMQDVLIEDVNGKDRIISGHCRTMCCRMLVEEGHEEFRKGHYGYDKDQTTFRAAYAALRDSMALSGDYGKKEVNQDG